MSGFYENIQSKTYQGHVHIYEFQDSLQADSQFLQRRT